MLGLLRFFLALSVIIAHLAEGVQFFAHWGLFAVFGFYLISGYLITTILNETYHFRFSAFVVNRFLRLFPIYYVVGVATIPVIILSDNASGFHPAWATQTSWIDILGNALIIPFEFYDSSFRLVPPAWSIAVELVNYLILWLIVARSRSLAVLVFLVACAYHIASLWSGADWGKRYYPFYAALLPFSLGAMVYFFRNSINTGSPRIQVLLANFSFATWLINLALCDFLGGIGGRLFSLLFYVNLAALSIFLYMMVNSPKSVPKLKWDKQIGDLAYPIFLTHWVISYMVGQYFLDGQRRGMILLAASIVPIIVVSYALAKMADKMIEPLRNQVRSEIKP